MATTHYGLYQPTGNDYVNPLIQDLANWNAIDTAMYNNACNSIPTATETKSGTVHALVRSNADARFFVFTATADYELGDTFTVDGTQVTAKMTDGTNLQEGAYVINASVLCCLVGTLLTVFVANGIVATSANSLKLGGELPSYYGTAQDVQTATTTANAASLLVNSLNNQLTTLIEGTLVAGQTTLTLTDVRILSTSIIDVYYEVGTGVETEPISYESITVYNGSVILTFAEREANLKVGIRVM